MIIYILLFVLVFVIYTFGVSGPVHRSMTRDQHQYPWYVGTFKTFKSKWNITKLEKSLEFRGSYFSKDRRSQWHASLIEFDGQFMVLSSWDFFLSSLWVRFFAKNKQSLKSKREIPKISQNNLIKDPYDRITPKSKIVPKKIT